MDHEHYMRRCLVLAKLGAGNVSPNPLVGAVIVHDDIIIGEGYHQQFGHAHAEVNAINSVKDKALLSDAKIYVSLEPCSHFGKTPPCANLIIDSKIPEVIICNVDPHEKVAGKGIELLENHGIKITKGVLEDEGKWLNRKFFHFHKEKSPYVILKWAQNQNGLMDKARESSEEGINWITAPETKVLSHNWRAIEDAILIGANTVINDSPSLTIRHSSGTNPLRVVIDPNSKIPNEHLFWKENTLTLIFSYNTRTINDYTEHQNIDDSKSIATQVLNELYNRNIQSVIIEGGFKTLRNFIDENLWNEARILQGKNNWKTGLSSPLINGLTKESKSYHKNSVKLKVKT